MAGELDKNEPDDNDAITAFSDFMDRNIRVVKVSESLFLREIVTFPQKLPFLLTPSFLVWVFCCCCWIGYRASPGSWQARG